MMDLDLEQDLLEGLRAAVGDGGVVQRTHLELPWSGKRKPAGLIEVGAATPPILTISRVLPSASPDPVALILTDPPWGAIPLGKESSTTAATDPD
jgi:hypothetical protein